MKYLFEKQGMQSSWLGLAPNSSAFKIRADNEEISFQRFFDRMQRFGKKLLILHHFKANMLLFS